MPPRDRSRPAETVSFTAAADVLEPLLRGEARRTIVERTRAAGGFEKALRTLRAAMRAHALDTGEGRVELARMVQALDARGREEGFHVLREWEQAEGRVSREELPVLMADHLARLGHAGGDEARSLAILLDFYFLYLLALLVVRAWDDPDAGRNLDRIDALLRALGGPGGSGERLVEDAGTLLFVATSNFHPDDRGFRALPHRVWALDEPRRLALATRGGAIVGAHLRWALPAIYERDLSYMRKDNAVDYPWLFVGAHAAMREYARLCDGGATPEARAPIVSALLCAISPDPWAFVGILPAPLAEWREEHDRFRALLERHRDALLEDAQARLPARDGYSPLALQFNFPHNALVARVVIALMDASAPNVPLDALLSAPATRSEGDAALLLARALTGYAAAHPERRGERRILPVAYNESIGLRSFSWTMSALKKHEGPAA